MPRKTSKTSKSTDSPERQTPDKQSEERPENWSYEQALSQIETITHQLETGELPLAEVFEQFSEAVSALQHCDRFLQEKQMQASLMIETLVGNEDNEAG